MIRNFCLSTLALASLVVCCAPVLAGDCCGDKEVAVVAAKTPQECFEAIGAAMMKNDRKAMFAQMSVKSQELATKKGEDLKKAATACADTQKKLGVTADEAKEMSGGELSMAMMIAHVKEMVAEKTKADGKEECEGGKCDSEAKEECSDEKCELADLKIDGDKATAKCPLGFPLSFVRENEIWKMDITAMMEGGCDKGGCDEGAAKE